MRAQREALFQSHITFSDIDDQRPQQRRFFAGLRACEIHEEQNGLVLLIARDTPSLAALAGLLLKPCHNEWNSTGFRVSGGSALQPPVLNAAAERCGH